MNTSSEKNGLGGAVGAVTELLKNPAVVEGILTGVSALAASRRVKNPSGALGGIDIGGMLELLPQIMPLVSMFSSSPGSGDDSGGAVSVSEDEDAAVAVSADVTDAFDGADAEKSGEESAPTASISYGSKQDRRENLLLAIRPFLSESRVAAADAMIQVNRISGLFGV